jgi:hypothetical protein
VYVTWPVEAGEEATKSTPVAKRGIADGPEQEKKRGRIFDVAGWIRFGFPVLGWC